MTGLGPRMIAGIIVANHSDGLDERRKVEERLAAAAGLLAREPRAMRHDRRYTGCDRFGQGAGSSAAIARRVIGAQQYIGFVNQLVIAIGRERAVEPDQAHHFFGKALQSLKGSSA